MTSAFPESRATGSLTRMFPVISLISHVTLYDICPSHGGLPRLFLRHYDVFPYYAYLFVSGYRLLSLSLSRFLLRPVLYPVRSPLVTYPTGRYFSLLPLRTLRPFVLVSSVLVYILGWRWDDPHLQSTLQPP